MSKIRLRPYQRLAIDNARDLIARGITAFIVHLATGLGKSIVTVKMVEELFPPEQYNTVVVGGINRQLTFQMAENFRKHMPQLDNCVYPRTRIEDTVGLGIVMGGINQIDRPVIIASIQTLVDKTDSIKKSAPEREVINKNDIVTDRDGGIRLNPKSKRKFLISPRYDQILASRGVTDVWIHDETHHCVADGSLILIMRLKQLREALGLSPLIIVGNTATPVRADEKSLSSVFDTFCISRGVAWAQANDYLTPFADPLMVRFDAEHIVSEVSHEDATLSILDNWAEKTVDVWVDKCYDEAENTFRPTMIFVGMINEMGAIDASKFLREEFAKRDIRCAHIDGMGIVDADGHEVSNKQRGRIFDEFQRGEIKVLVNHNVLTEGVDLPLTSCVMLLRKVNDVNFTQIIGRALRKFPGDPRYGLPEKEDTLLIDFIGQELVINSVASLIGFRVDPFTQQYVMGLDADQIIEQFLEIWGVGEEMQELILTYVEQQTRFRSSTLRGAIDLVTIEGMVEVALTDTQLRGLRMIIDFLGEDTIQDGSDLKDMVPENFIQGKTEMYSIKKIISKSSGDWFSDAQTAIMTLTVGKNDSLLMHPPNHTMTRKVRELVEILQNRMSGEKTGTAFDALDDKGISGYMDLFRFAETLFSNFTLWHINTAQVWKPFIEGGRAWVAESEYLDQMEIDAITYAHEHIPGKEDIFMNKRKNWKAKTVNGNFNAATEAQTKLLKNLAGDLYAGLEQPIAKGEAAKYITYFACIKPVNKIVSKLTEQINQLTA